MVTSSSPLPAAPPLSWTPHELTLNIDIPHGEELYIAIGIALRSMFSEPPPEDMTIEIVHGDDRRSHIIVPCSNDLNESWSPVLSQDLSNRPSIAIVEDSSIVPSDIPFRLSPPIVLCIRTAPGRTILQLWSSTSGTADGRSGWLLIYIARSLRYTRAHGSPGIPRDLTIRPLDTLLSCIGSTPKRELLSDIPLHQHFAEVVQSNPLAIAVIYYNIKDGFADAQERFTYGGLFSCALFLAHKLLKLPHDDGACIAITSTDIATFTVVSLAAALCGRTFTSTASDQGESSILDTRTGRILQESAVQLLADPECLLYKGDLWEALADAVIPVSVDPTVPACLLHFAAKDGASARYFVSHAKLVEVFKRRRTKFECPSSVKVLFHQCTFEDWAAVFVWETFLHHGVVEVIKARDQCPDIHAASLVQQLGSSHLITDSEDVILSLCETLGVVRSKQALKAILVKTKGFVEPLAQFAGLKMITYDEDWNEAAQIDLPPTPPEKPDILYQDPEFSVDPISILERVSKGKALDNMGANVTNIGDGLLVKYGVGVRMTEVHNALYARKNTTIPIPNVHLVFKLGNVVYMVTDYIHGANLLRRWTTLTEHERCSVLSQLKDYLTQLRDLRGSTPGPVDGSRFEGPWFTFYGKDPFPAYEDMVAWLNRMLKYSHAEHLVEPFSTAHPLVFTHQDISPRNLILDDEGKLWVIDWDRAGWYPIYFEYACIQVDIGVPEAPTPEDWCNAAHSVMPDYSKEYRSLRAIAAALDTMPLAY